MLDDHVNALVLNALNLCAAHFAGQEAVLRIILEVAAAVGRTMGIAARTIETDDVGKQAVVADHVAHIINEIPVEGRRHHVLGGEGRGLDIAQTGAQNGGRQALRAVLVAGAGGLHGSDRHSPVEGIADGRDHFLKGQLIQQLFPIRIIIVLADHVIERQAVVSAQSGHHHRCIVGGIILNILQSGNQLVGQRQLQGLRGPGAFPIVAAQPDNLLFHAVIEIDIRRGELVFNGRAIEGNRIGGGIQLFLRPHKRHVGIAFGVHAVGSGIAFRSEDVVDRVMRIGRHGQIVIAGVQNIGARAVGIIGSQIPLVHINRNGFRAARLQNAGLVKAAQLNGSLFHVVVDVILGVGRLRIDLNGLLARCLAMVGHSNAHFILIGSGIVFHRHVGVAELGVAQTMAKRECNIVAVDKAAGIAGAHNDVFIAGLIILVAHIDAFLIDHIALGAVRNQPEVAGVPGRHKIPHGGRGVVVIAVGVHQRAGGIDLARQNIRHRIGSADAHAADPQTGVDVIGIPLEEIHLQRIRGVEQHNDAPDRAGRLQIVRLGGVNVC